MELILEKTEFRHYLDDGTQEGEDRWANVMELYNLAASGEFTSLSSFLEQVALVSEADNLEEHPSAATLLTLHAAKGLEFPVVFITGLEDGMLPHSRSLDDGESLAEERRLFYVGITRAKDRVYLSHVFRRAYFGSTEVTVPSRFLNDLPGELTEGLAAGDRRQQSKSRASSWSWSGNDADNTWKWQGSSRRRPVAPGSSFGMPLPEPPYKNLSRPAERPASESPRPKYSTGQKVRHSKFGDGIVIESKVTGSDEEVSVAFAGSGIKRLAASFAGLEKVAN
jgi:DNA helicase-2/ATP-dependent DNA helicase PcrA